MNTDKTSSAPKAEKKSRKSRTRLVLITLALLATVTATFVGTRWLWYRSTHLVVHDATIKGTIVKLGARFDGQVKNILATPGERVSKGQVLVQLEDQHLQAARSRAQAELECASKELDSEKLAVQEDRRRLATEVERSASLLQSATAVLEGAQSRAGQLSSEFDRIAELRKEGTTSASELDRITGDRDKAQADVRAAASMREAAQSSLQTARLQLEALKVREAKLGVLEAQVSVARARLEVAEADLQATRLLAPEEGFVVERIVEVGGSAKVGDPILSVWIGRPWVEGWASETSMDRLQIGSKAQVSLDAFPGQKLSGRIEAFGLLTDKELLDRPVPSSIDSLIRKDAQVRLRIALEDGNIQLQPGLSAVVGIEKSSSKSVLGHQNPPGRIPPATHHLAATSQSGQYANQENH